MALIVEAYLHKILLVVHFFSPLIEKENKNGDESVEELKRQLREKDLVLTDIRLEALSSAHQLESLKDTVLKMRNEMHSLKQDNERLQRLVTSKSLTSSQSSLTRGSEDTVERRFSMNDALSGILHSVNAVAHTILISFDSYSIFIFRHCDDINLSFE